MTGFGRCTRIDPGFGLENAEISVKMAKIPRDFDVFSTYFYWSANARFLVPFSVRSKSPYIQGIRKVENVFGIFIHPIWTPLRNWWQGWGFGDISAKCMGWGVHFQCRPFPHRYRGLGKSTLRVREPLISSVFSLYFRPVLSENDRF